MKRILLVLVFLFIGCIPISKHEVIHCVNKPNLLPFKCRVECGLYTSNMLTAEHECMICREDLLGLLVYIKYIEKYSSDECITIKE